jgi:hypothetical protein
MNYLSICAQFRNENHWLDEFIRYHNHVGIEHFYMVCDDDNPFSAYKILRPYIKNGLVSFIHTKDIVHREWCYDYWSQCDVYKYMVDYLIGKTQWVAMIDLDEFILPKTCDDIREVLQEFEEYDGLAINWSIFGSSGYVERPKTQINHLLHRAEFDIFRNGYVKSIIKPETVDITKVNDTHWFPSIGNGTVNENYETITCQYFHPPSVDKMRLNHYIIRCKDDYIERKSKGSRNFKGGSFPCDDQYYKDHDLNDIFDDEISVRFGIVVE